VGEASVPLTVIVDVVKGEERRSIECFDVMFFFLLLACEEYGETMCRFVQDALTIERRTKEAKTAP